MPSFFLPKRAAAALLFTGLLLCFSAPAAHAQTPSNLRVSDPNANAWLMYFSDARLSERWGVHTEAQWRRAELGQRPLQNFFRAGANYYTNQNLMLTAGYAYALTFPYGDFPVAEKFPERRIYEQLLLKNAHGPVQVAHRFRQEQRWLRRPLQSEYTYLNRTRYQVRAAVALRRPSAGILPHTPYLAVSDEVFVNFGRNVARNIFDQNRAYAALGYQFTKALALELGYLHHLVAQGNGTVFEYNHTLQVGVTFNPDLRQPLAKEPDPEKRGEH
jgi:hypothetical protein